VGAVCCVARTVSEQQKTKLDSQWVRTVMKSPMARFVTHTF